MNWKPIVGFEGRYLISDNGDVMSLEKGFNRSNESKRCKPHIVNLPEKSITGWTRYRKNGAPVTRFVTLRKDNKSFTYRVHRLVLEAFVGNCPNGMEACHNDGNPLNNSISNLRWDTHKENVADCIRHGRKTDPPIHCGEKHPRSKLTDMAVKFIRSRKYHHGLFASLSKRFNVSLTTISRVYGNKEWILSA